MPPIHSPYHAPDFGYLCDVVNIRTNRLEPWRELLK